MRATCIAVGMAVALSGLAHSQEKISKEQLVGTWTMVSYKNVSSGSKTDIFGRSRRVC